MLLHYRSRNVQLPGLAGGEFYPHRPSEGAASTQILPFGLVRLERALVSQSVDSQLGGMDLHCAEQE